MRGDEGELTASILHEIHDGGVAERNLVKVLQQVQAAHDGHEAEVDLAQDGPVRLVVDRDAVRRAHESAGLVGTLVQLHDRGAFLAHLLFWVHNV